MVGADEYAHLFSTGRIGKLYMVSGAHARGLTFEIWVLPSETAADNLAPGASPRGLKDVVQVYGITGGQPGWTETYGWLHHGPWEKDFANLVKSRKRAIQAALDAKLKLAEDVKAASQRREKELLAKY